MGTNETVGSMREIKRWLSDLFEFIWAVLHEWAVYATGGVIVAVLWLVSTLVEIHVSKKANVGIALVFLFLAFFNAWRKQYRHGLTLE